MSGTQVALPIIAFYLWLCEKLARDHCFETGNSHLFPMKRTSGAKGKKGTYIRLVPSDNILLEQAEQRDTERKTGNLVFVSQSPRKC